MIAFPAAEAAQWQHPDHVSLSDNEQSWLLAEGSLTHKLKQQAATFSVDVIGQQKAPVFDSEFDLFRRHHTDTPFDAVVREVLLCCNRQPWVFARSIFPISALDDKNLNLSSLGSASLGQSLFDKDDLLRSTFEIAQLESCHAIAKLNDQFHHQQHPLWGRRSLFMTAGQKVLVSEFFLSPVPIYAEQS